MNSWKARDIARQIDLALLKVHNKHGNDMAIMSRRKAIATLKLCQQDSDIEAAHSKADDVLCDLLQALGYLDVVVEYNKVNKWYA